MSFIDDLIAKGQALLGDLSDNTIGEIKDYIGRFYTFENKINKIKKELNSGSYSVEIIQKFNEIQERQKKLQEQVDRFVNMTDTAGAKFTDVSFNLSYIKSKFNDISEITAIAYQFLTETKPEINKQEREITDIQELMKGNTNQTILNVKNFVKDHWLISSVIGFIVIKKILK